MADNERQSPPTETSTGAPPIETLGFPRRGTTHAHRHIHIVLLGLMGAGKSTVGRIVARELGRPFVDSDSIVELHGGKLPHEIAARSCLEELHRLEADAARHVLATSHAVVFAAAASLVETITTEELESAWSAWLDSPPDVLARRIEGDGPRPALESSPERVLAEQYEARIPHARQLVDCVIDTRDLSPTEVAEQVCERWRRFAAQFEASAAS